MNQMTLKIDCDGKSELLVIPLPATAKRIQIEVMKVILRLQNYNKTATAKLCGISRASIYRIMLREGL